MRKWIFTIVVGSLALIGLDVVVERLTVAWMQQPSTRDATAWIR